MFIKTYIPNTVALNYMSDDEGFFIENFISTDPETSLDVIREKSSDDTWGEVTEVVGNSVTVKTETLQLNKIIEKLAKVKPDKQTVLYIRYPLSISCRIYFLHGKIDDFDITVEKEQHHGPKEEIILRFGARAWGLSDRSNRFTRLFKFKYNGSGKYKRKEHTFNQRDANCICNTISAIDYVLKKQKPDDMIRVEYRFSGEDHASYLIGYPIKHQIGIRQETCS